MTHCVSCRRVWLGEQLHYTTFLGGVRTGTSPGRKWEPWAACWPRAFPRAAGKKAESMQMHLEVCSNIQKFVIKHLKLKTLPKENVGYSD